MFICVQPFFACIGRRSHRLLAAARSHLPCKAKEAFLRSRELMTNLKPRPSGEVAATADGEGCRDFRPLAVRIECRREQATRPTEEVNSTCHNEISLFKIHRLLLPENTIGQPRTKVPTVRKRAFVFSRIKKRCGARRAPQTVRWTVCSQSGEQFIIATWGVSRDTVAVVVTNDFFASFFFAEKKKVLHTANGRLSIHKNSERGKPSPAIEKCYIVFARINQI